MEQVGQVKYGSSTALLILFYHSNCQCNVHYMYIFSQFEQVVFDCRGAVAVCYSKTQIRDKPIGRSWRNFSQSRLISSYFELREKIYKTEKIQRNSENVNKLLPDKDARLTPDHYAIIKTEGVFDDNKQLFLLIMHKDLCCDPSPELSQ